MAHDLQGLQALGLRLTQARDLRTIRDQGRPPATSYSHQIRSQPQIPGALQRPCHAYSE